MTSAGCAALFLVAFLCPLVFSTTAKFALYTLTLAVPNQLSIFSGDANGQVTFVSQINTGGDGITSDQPGIGSQGAVVVYGNYIFAVNPGSDTLSLFSISTSDPTNVQLIGTANTGGDWPVSVAANANWACVVNAGTNNGLRCFTYSASGLTAVAGSDRSFNITLTQPPIVHTGPAQISFLPGNSGLAISNKGANPPVLLYTITNNVISTTSVSTPNLGMVPFGFDFDTDGTLFLSDAAPLGGNGGIELVAFNTGATPSASFSLPAYFIIPNQNGACWVVRSPTLGTFFVANSASQNISEISRSGTTLTILGTYATGANTTPLDEIVAYVNGVEYLFVTSSGTEVLVFSLAGGKGKASLVQTVDLHANGSKGAGVATYVVPATGSTSTSTTSEASALGRLPLVGLLVGLCAMLL